MAYGAKPREERQFDTTYLSERINGRSVGRDYAAHYFRWGFAFRYCAGKSVLDVGCGPDFPLGHSLTYHGRSALRAEPYVGVDLHRLKKPENKHLKLHGEFDFTTRYPELVAEYGLFDVATCFEVIEHMGEDDQRRLLWATIQCLKPGGTFLLSTPVRAENGHMARNHIRELTVAELEAMVRLTGFEVERRFGTYGDVKSLEAAATPAQREVMTALAEYYSNDVMANFLAPLHPDACKNNLWVLRKP